VTLGLAEQPLGEAQPRELIVSLYGLYARAEQNWLSVASLVRLMSELGVDAPAVRSSVSRLKRRDTLRSLRIDGAAGYALSPSSVKVLRTGDARIFNGRRATLADGWVLLVFSVPETERDRRHELRTYLTRLGFGTVAPGVWVAPAHLAPEAREVLAWRGLDSYVDIFRADHLAFGDVRAKVGQWWDLDELSARFEQFIDAYSSAGRRRGVRTDQAAFREYVPMLTAWRRLPYLDPGLPLEVLPVRWKGVTASSLFAELDGRLREPARRHAWSVVHGGSG
jgi:phenylacetic acid degradation operon negative regulatory protein